MSRRRWSHTEILAVADRYKTEGPTLLAREYHRSENSISSLARRIGVRTSRKPYQRRASDR